jgi:hypothetical protein
LKNNAAGSDAMQTSSSSVFGRVNRRRPCRICGKPDWCSYVRDGERISVCMRVSDGARKINHHGGAIFIHEDWREGKGIDVRVIADIPQSPIAPVEIRDFVYNRLIDLSPATLYPGALVELTCSRPVWIGFDQDHYSNETVCFHLAALVARRLRRERTLATTRIASWDAKVKGIDDAAAHNLPITSISVRRWLDRLSPRFRQIAMARLSEIAEVSWNTRNRKGSQRQ